MIGGRRGSQDVQSPETEKIVVENGGISEECIFSTAIYKSFFTKNSLKC